MAGRWSSAISAERIRRSRDWRYAAPCRRRSTPTPGTGSRASVCRTCTSRSSRRASRCPGTSTSPQGLDKGNGVILALPASRRVGVGRSLARAPRRQDHGRRRAARSARAVRLVRQSAQRARHDGRGARTGCRQGRARSAQAQRGGVPALRPRPRRPGGRGRVLRRTHDACRPGPPRSASARAHRSCRPRCTSRRATTATSGWSARRSTRLGPDRCATTSRRVTQQLARELELLITRAPQQWHLFQPNWPSDPGLSEESPGRSARVDRRAVAHPAGRGARGGWRVGAQSGVAAPLGAQCFALAFGERVDCRRRYIVAEHRPCRTVDELRT